LLRGAIDFGNLGCLLLGNELKLRNELCVECTTVKKIASELTTFRQDKKYYY